jgi:hypothetical protein
MRLSLPLAVVLALLANLVPSFGKAATPQPAASDTPPQAQK